MKKIIHILLLLQSGFIMAQTETVVTPNGKKVQINPYVNNGLQANNGYVQLGGALVQLSVITTDSNFTLGIAGLTPGSAADNILVLDSNNILRKVSGSSLTAAYWSILGNAGTNSSVNFLGTTDNTPLVFKVNNQYAGKLSSTSTAFGYNALNSVTPLQGAGNTAIGVSSMALTTSTGMYNTALGANTLANNTTGSKNIAIGYNTGNTITTGSNNITIGSASLLSTSSATASNEMNIGNTLYGTGVNNTNTGKIGVNTNAPTAEMDVNGYARVRSMDVGDLTDNVVTADANGNLRQRAAIDVAAPSLGFAKLGSGVNFTASGSYFYTGTVLTLGLGKWLVTVNMLLSKSSGTLVATGATETWWVRSGFSNSSTVFATSSDIISTNTLISGLLPSSSYYAMLYGTVIINNTSGANKNYYYWGGNVAGVNPAGTMLNFGGSNWSEDYVTFQKIN
ncbi:hypothetical protein PQ462_02400 [Flavobacterium sp. KACC 22758]|uniref:hypothetical protein n=1 Tax=Flavobacterium sp. KACC 22758 TaxID=3025667 RepID=UPI0023653E33|nr:hypothetical protein [Flavobacterium sp. KACC 22758]WDF60228.1 hypothetical protein PQ462_02400 [Flavobacterium sp. KACC 22758]